VDFVNGERVLEKLIESVNGWTISHILAYFWPDLYGSSIFPVVHSHTYFIYLLLVAALNTMKLTIITLCVCCSHYWNTDVRFSFFHFVRVHVAFIKCYHKRWTLNICPQGTFGRIMLWRMSSVRPAGVIKVLSAYLLKTVFI